MLKGLQLFPIISFAWLYSCTPASSSGNAFSFRESPSASEAFMKYQAARTPAEISVSSVITCPKCQFKKTEKLPTEVCQLAYTCQNCKTVLHPKKGDCCVFCTYGDHKCPSMQ